MISKPTTLSSLVAAMNTAEMSVLTTAPSGTSNVEFRLPTFNCATSAERPICWAMDLNGVKVLHLIRHAQSHSNSEAARRGPIAYR